MRRLWWWARQRGGWPMAGALLAWALALATDTVVAPAWRANALALQQQALEQRREARDAALRALPAVAAAGMATADADWPAVGAASARMADLLDLAVRHGVAVERLQRRDSQGTATQLERSALLMPVRAGYADLRRFVAHALQADPALALERPSLRRPRPDAAELEGELQWVLVQRAGAGAAAVSAPGQPQAPTSQRSAGRAVP